MSTRRRTTLAVQARRPLQSLLVSEGQKIRRARKRPRWTQVDLARRTGVSPSTISALERGDGGAQAALVLDLPLKIEIGRDLLEEPVDAGHLRIQELGRATRRRRTLELATKPDDPTRSTDVGLTDDAARPLLLIECVNSSALSTLSIRSSDRKRAEAERWP